jgi:predicted phosphodiesterase
MRTFQSSLLIPAISILAYGTVKMEHFSYVNAQPSLIHLSLQEKTKADATTPLAVTWSCDNCKGKQYVKFGLTADPGKKVKAERSEFDGRNIFNADLKRLKHGAKYYYRCGSDREGWSSVYSFYSEPATGSFRVGVIGDTQDNNNNEEFRKTEVITDLVRNNFPHLTLHMGDIVNDGSNDASWINFLSVTEGLNSVSPLMPVLGNHDIENTAEEDFQKPFQEFYSLFKLPGDEVNYSFSYGRVRFVGIFSGCAQAASKTDQVMYKPGSPEYLWLDNELTNAGRDENLNWIIVWMHYPVLSFGWSNIERWKENILPLLQKHKIDLCLAGHRHVYERHYQVKDGTPLKNESGSEFSARNGTIFITNGSAGGNPTMPGGEDLPTLAFTPDKTMYNFAILDVSPESLIYRVFDQDNNLIDRFTLMK